MTTQNYPDLERSILEQVREFLSGKKRGRLQKIRLTFGGAGNQIMTINGVDYATWIDYKEWPALGSIIEHKPYTEQYRNWPMECTKILDVAERE